MIFTFKLKYKFFKVYIFLGYVLIRKLADTGTHFFFLGWKSRYKSWIKYKYADTFDGK